jgi:hypothetical protein
VTRLMRHANEYVTKTIYGGRPGTQEAQTTAIGSKLEAIGAARHGAPQVRLSIWGRPYFARASSSPSRVRYIETLVRRR